MSTLFQHFADAKIFPLKPKPVERKTDTEPHLIDPGPDGNCVHCGWGPNLYHHNPDRVAYWHSDQRKKDEADLRARQDAECLNWSSHDPSVLREMLERADHGNYGMCQHPAHDGPADIYQPNPKARPATHFGGGGWPLCEEHRGVADHLPSVQRIMSRDAESERQGKSPEERYEDHRADDRRHRMRVVQRKHAAADDDLDDIHELLAPIHTDPKEYLRQVRRGLTPRPTPEKTPEQKADEEAEHQQRIREHHERQAKRPGINPGEDISTHQMGREYPHAEWVPLHVAQHFREHEGDQSPDSAERVSRLTEELRSGRGMTDPLLLIHHNESGVATLGEGNHRLKAAENAGWTHVPMRVVRMYDSAVDRPVTGANDERRPRQIPYVWRGAHQGRTPEMARPSEVFHFDSLQHLPRRYKESSVRVAHKES